MRKPIINGNGYECDVCHKLLMPGDVIRIRSYMNADSTGAQMSLDTIGVCEQCYKREFHLLYKRGPLRNKK